MFTVLLYETTIFEKKLYAIQGILAFIFSALISVLFVLTYSYFGATMSFFGTLIFYGTALILPIVLLTFFIESLNLMQKMFNITRIIKQSSNPALHREGLKEYFGYYKSYFGYYSNLKYDIDKQIEFLNSGF